MRARFGAPWVGCLLAREPEDSSHSGSNPQVAGSFGRSPTDWCVENPQTKIDMSVEFWPWVVSRSRLLLTYLIPSCRVFAGVRVLCSLPLNFHAPPTHASVSCNCHTHIEKLGLWNRLSTVVGDVDCVLHLGDQIYADEDFGAK